MILLYIILIVYILAVNFYAFLSMRNLTSQSEKAQAELATKPEKEKSHKSENAQAVEPSAKKQREFLPDWRLLVTGAAGGAITIYVCMFIYKYKLNNLLLMVLMPVLAAINLYLWILLFSKGFFIAI